MPSLLTSNLKLRASVLGAYLLILLGKKKNVTTVREILNMAQSVSSLLNPSVKVYKQINDSLSLCNS